MVSVLFGFSKEVLVALEPLQHPRIEVVHNFPVEGVTGSVVKVTVAVGDACCYLLSHPERSEDIVFASNDETGGRDLAQLGAR